jgi:tetratricopeptide (TPR) repeat protein
MCSRCKPRLRYGRYASDFVLGRFLGGWGFYFVGSDLAKDLKPDVIGCRCSCSSGWLDSYGCRKCRHVISNEEKGLKINEDAREFYHKAHDAAHNKDYNLAHSLLIEAFGKDKNFPGIYEGLIVTSIRIGNYEDASRYAELFLTKMPNNARPYYWMGRVVLAKDKDYKSALRYFKDAANLDADNYLYYSLCGFCYYKLGSYSVALTSLNLALKRNPKDFKSLILRADIYIKLGSKTEAINDLKYALEIAGENAAARKLLEKVKAP